MSSIPVYEDIYVLHSIIIGYSCPPLHYTRIFHALHSLVIVYSCPPLHYTRILLSSTPFYEDINVLHSIIQGY